MKYIAKNLLSLCALILAVQFVSAQASVTTYGVKVSNIVMQQNGGRLNVGMTMDLSDIIVRSNASLQITPVVTNGQEMIQLPSVFIDGRRRQIMHQRANDGMLPSADIYVRRYNHREQIVEYSSDVAYEQWMNNSDLVLSEAVSGCRNTTLSEEFATVASLSQAQQPAAKPQMQQKAPHMAYVTPAAENSKTQGNAAIYFPVNRSNINPDYMGNKQQLADLKGLFDNAKEINSVHLMGYASPEGPYEFNKSLAARRASAVEEYMKKNNINATNVTMDSAPANWDAVKQLLTQSCINNYRFIVEIIDNPAIKPADKNAEIKRRYPVEYAFMLDTWYPKLRVTDVNVDYKSQPLSVDDAKRLMNENPSQLSLSDIYMVALTYEKGSKEWNDIIIFAVNAYPESPEARVNAANVAMDNGNYAQAAAYLQGVPTDMPQAMNSRGILAMSQGEYDKAMSLFTQAQKAGVNEAAYNIALLRELMQLAN